MSYHLLPLLCTCTCKFRHAVESVLSVLSCDKSFFILLSVWVAQVSLYTLCSAGSRPGRGTWQESVSALGCSRSALDMTHRACRSLTGSDRLSPRRPFPWLVFPCTRAFGVSLARTISWTMVLFLVVHPGFSNQRAERHSSAAGALGHCAVCMQLVGLLLLSDIIFLYTHPHSLSLSLSVF